MIRRMIKTYGRAILFSLLLISALLLFKQKLPADEGMWPLSELHRLNLKERDSG